MAHNPYAPPKAKVEDASDAPVAPGTPNISARLYSPVQLGVGAFIGSPFAAAWLAAINFRLLGDPVNARRVLLWGALGTIAIMAIAFFLPDGLPNSILPIAYSVAIRMGADKPFELPLKEHLKAGGRKASWWRVVGVGFLCLIALIIVIAAVVLVLEMLGVSLE